MKRYVNISVIVIFAILSLFIFRDYFFKNLVPFPANLLGSFYQPWASYRWEGYPNGPPGRPLGFDNLRIFYPSRRLVIDQIRNFQLPLWNPYNFSGNVLLGTYQSAVFHPLSFLFLFLPQIDAWSIAIILQPFLASFFTYLFLREISLDKKASFFGAVTFGFSGIMIVWWEEMFMAGYSVLFLPLILFSIEKLYKNITFKIFALLIVGLSFSVFSGWFQGSFYIWTFSFIWGLYKYLTSKVQVKRNFLYILCGYLLSILICAIHLLPSIEAYLYSPRGSIDIKTVFQTYLVPLNHLVTFVAPDFFGNPAVHNYYGGGFYHEKVIFIGMLGFIFALFELLYIRKNNSNEKFFKIAWIISLSLGFSLPTSWFILYYLKLPLISVMLPSRIFFISMFCMSIVSAYGIKRYMKQKSSKKIFLPLIAVFLILFVSWIDVNTTYKANLALVNYYQVALRNLIIPSVFWSAAVVVLISGLLFGKLRKKMFYVIVLITFIGIVYFANKYLYFSDRTFVFADTPVISRIKKISSINRFWGVGDGYIDRNFATYYKIFAPDGYEPFYPSRYGELLYSSHTNGLLSSNMPRADAVLMKADTLEHAVENRYRLKLFSLLNVKYIIDSNNYKHTNLDNTLSSYHLKKVWNDGKFNIYEYKDALPRFFMVGDYEVADDRQKILDQIYSDSIDLSKKIILEETPKNFSKNSNAAGKSTLISYKPTEVAIKTSSNFNMLLFISDNFYPGWNALVDGKPSKIYRADYSFRAVVVPAGKHVVRFIYQPLSFVIGAIITLFGLLIFFLISKKIK